MVSKDELQQSSQEGEKMTPSEILSLHSLVVGVATLIASVASLITAITALFKIRDLHVEVNSKMAEFLRVSNLAAEARGNLKGIEEEQARVK